MPNLTVDPQTDPLISNDQISVSPSSHNFSKSILIGILIFVLLALTAYGTYWYTKNYLVIPSSQPGVSNFPSGTSQTNNSFANLNQTKSFLTATPSTTRSGWLIHRFLDFSLELPKEWKVETETGSSKYFRFQNYTDTDLTNLQTPSAFANNTKGFLFMEIYGEEYAGDVNDYVIRDQKNGLNSPGESPKWEDANVTVGGVSAVKAHELTGIIHGDGPGVSFIVYVKHPEKPVVYRIVFYNPFKNYQSLADQILSTFKFIDDGQANSLAAWYTFNFSPTISFNLPPDVKKPLYVNAGQYAQETILPGGTALQLWGADGASPGGKESSLTYDSILNQFAKATGFITKWQSFTVAGRRAIEFTSNESQSTFIMGGAVYTRIRGLFIETPRGLLMVAHYASKDIKENSNFEGDDVLFGQILATLKFLP